MHAAYGVVGLALLASLTPVAARLGAQAFTYVELKTGSITFTQGGKSFTWALRGQANYAEFPAPTAGFQFVAIYKEGGQDYCPLADQPQTLGACPTLTIGIRSFEHESPGYTSSLSISVDYGPVGDVRLNGAPKQCRIAFTRHSTRGIEGSGDCTGVTFQGRGAPIGKFTFTAAP